MGKKRRMMLRYDETGKVIPCTVIEVEPSVVVQKKTKEIDGYDALQLAHGKVVTHDPRTVTKRVRPRVHLSSIFRLQLTKGPPIRLRKAALKTGLISDTIMLRKAPGGGASKASRAGASKAFSNGLLLNSRLS